MLHAWIKNLTVKLHEEILVIQKVEFCPSLCVLSWKYPISFGESLTAPFPQCWLIHLTFLNMCFSGGSDSMRGFQEVLAFGKNAKGLAPFKKVSEQGN